MTDICCDDCIRAGRTNLLDSARFHAAEAEHHADNAARHARRAERASRLALAAVVAAAILIAL